MSVQIRAQILIALAVGLSASAAVAAPEGKISEIQEQGGSGTSVLVQLGAKEGIRVGQTVEVRRGDRTVGYGSVVKVFKDITVVSVGTVVPGSGELKAGDSVVFLDSGFSRGEPVKAAGGKTEPTNRPVSMPSGKVVNVRDGVVLLDFGADSGLRSGDSVSLRSPTGHEVGVISVELVGPKSAGGLLVSGTADVGLTATSLGRSASPDGDIDFVALDFLGVVANLEHPTPHRAACHVGVPVRRILPGSPAQKAGLGKGDRLISVDGIVVRDIGAVRERIQARQARRVRIVLLRGDRIVAVDVDFETQ